MDTAKINDPTLTVDEFCAAEKISKAQLYLDWKAGTGPTSFSTANAAASLTKHAHVGDVPARKPPRPHFRGPRHENEMHLPMQT